MAAPLNTCTTIEQRGVVRFLWAKIYGSKGYPQRNAAHMGKFKINTYENLNILSVCVV
jgi:hypothetical protein